MKQVIVVAFIIVSLLVGMVAGYGAAHFAYTPQIEGYKTQVSSLTSEVSRLTASVSKQEGQISALKSNLGEAESKISTLQTTLREEQTKVSDLRTSLAGEQAKVSDLAAKMSSLQTNLSHSQKTISDRDTQLSSLQTKLAAEQVKVSDLAAKVSTLQIELSSAQKTLSTGDIQTASLRSQLVSYETQLATLQSRLNRILDITVPQLYEWRYGGSTWKWDLPISLKAYVNYQEQPRPISARDYVLLAKDPSDDAYIDQMVQQINRAAIGARFLETEKVNFVIAFVQSLPYTVDNVTTPYNEYPRYPLETLFDRGGDCEDTSILVAALLDRMGYDVALLALPEGKHMAVGVNIPGAYGSYYAYRDSGKKYFYLETTGDGWKIGEMPPEYKEMSAYIYPLKP